MKLCFLADGRHVNTISWVQYLANELEQEIHLIGFEAVQAAHSRIKTYPLGVGSRSPLRYVAYIPAVRKLVHEIQPHILIGYRITSYGFMAALSGFHPLVLAAQGQNIAYNASRIKACFARYAIRRADLIHSWGPHMTTKLEELRADPAKILTLPRGIDTRMFKPVQTAEDPERPGRGFTIISTRGLNPDYNFEQILAALTKFKQSREGFTYTVAGDGSFRAALEQRVRAMGLSESVKFLGRVRHEEVAKELQAADVYVSTVVTDGVSASLLEAMACGTFPVVTDNAANRLWIRHGVNGYLVRYGDPDDLAQKIRAAGRDAALRRRAAATNWVLVQQRACIHTNMRQFVAMWARLCGQHVQYGEA